MEKLEAELEENQNHPEEIKEENKNDEDIIEKQNQQEELTEDEKELDEESEGLSEEEKKAKILKITNNINVKKSRILIINKEYETLKTSLDELDKDINSYEPYNTKVLEYLDKVESCESDNNREKVYEIASMKELDKEERFLEEFISSGVISNEYRILFSDDSFLKGVLNNLEEENFRNYSIYDI